MSRLKTIGVGVLACLVLVVAVLLRPDTPATSAESHEPANASTVVEFSGSEVSSLEPDSSREELSVPTTNVAADATESSRELEAVLSMRARLTLRAFWEDDGAPAERIAARLYYSTGSGARSELRVGITDSRGELLAGELPAGRALLELDRGSQKQIELRSGAEVLVEFALPSGIDTEISVVDPAGALVSSALVWRVPEYGNAARYPLGLTDARGFLRCRGLRVQDRLIAYHSEYQPSAETLASLDGKPSETRLQLTEGPSTTLIGRVLSESGEPIANASVSIHTKRKQASAPGVQADSRIRLVTSRDGEFVSPPLATGIQRVSAYEPHHIVAFQTLDNAQGVTQLEFRLKRGVQVEGVVHDTLGLRCAEAYVELAGSETYSDHDGRFVLTGVSPNAKALRASHPTAGRAELAVSLVPGQPIDIVLSSERVISGRLERDDGSPLPGWTIVLAAGSPEDYDSWNQSARTAPDGAFAFTHCPPGPNRLGVRNGLDFESVFVKEVAEVSPDGPFLTIRVSKTEMPTARLTGVLTELASSTLRPSLTLTNEDLEPGRHRLVRYDATGAFKIGPLVPGEYRVWLACEGAAPREMVRVSLGPDELHDVGALACR